MLTTIFRLFEANVELGRQPFKEITFCNRLYCICNCSLGNNISSYICGMGSGIDVIF